LGILRQLYDGTFEKSYGNGILIKWEGKLSLVAGTTTKIYSLLYQFSALGERYLLYNFVQPDRKFTTRKSLKAEAMMEKVAEEEIGNAFKEYLDGIKIPETLPVMEESLIDDLVDLAEFVTRARSVVERDMRNPKKIIIQVHDLEMPMRFAKQVNAIAYGLKVINGNRDLENEDKNLIYKLALDSIPVMRRICLRNLTHYRTISTAGLAETLQLPTDTVNLALGDLASLGVATRIRVKSNRDEWEIKDEYRALLSKFEKIEVTDQDLEEETIADSDLIETVREVFEIEGGS